MKTIAQDISTFGRFMLSWCVEAAQWVYDVIRRHLPMWKPGSVAQTVASLTEESEVLDSISGLAFCFRGN